MDGGDRCASLGADTPHCELPTLALSYCPSERSYRPAGHPTFELRQFKEMADTTAPRRLKMNSRHRADTPRTICGHREDTPRTLRGHSSDPAMTLRQRPPTVAYTAQQNCHRLHDSVSDMTASRCKEGWQPNMRRIPLIQLIVVKCLSTSGISQGIAYQIYVAIIIYVHDNRYLILMFCYVLMFCNHYFCIVYGFHFSKAL